MAQPFQRVVIQINVGLEDFRFLQRIRINGKVVVRDGEIVTMDMGPVVETHNRCAFQLANEA